MLKNRVFSGVLGVAALLMGSAVGATVLITVEEALALAFPDAKADRETLFLSEDQRATVEERSGVEVKSGLATRFVARSDGPDLPNLLAMRWDDVATTFARPAVHRRLVSRARPGFIDDWLWQDDLESRGAKQRPADVDLALEDESIWY